MLERLTSIASAAALALGVGAGALSAQASPAASPELDDGARQAQEAPEITVFNAHLYGVKVYTVGPEGEDHLLGTVATDEVESFGLSSEALQGRDRMRLSLFPLGPGSGLGTPPASNSVMRTDPFPVNAGEPIKVILNPGLDDPTIYVGEAGD